MAYCKLHGRCSLKTSRKTRSKIPLFFTIVAGIRSANFINKVLSCEFCKIFNNSFFREHLRAPVSGYWHASKNYPDI